MRDAHRAQATNAGPARGELVQRYLPAVYRYLLAVVRNADLADELCQEFALKFLGGEFHRADPERGRFRDYVKSVIFNLVRSYHRNRGKWPAALPDQVGEQSPETDDDTTFAGEWREEVLNQTWQALEQQQSNYFHVLKLRVENPDLSSRELAERYATAQNKPMTAANVRKILERAHARFADLMVAEVAESLEAPAESSLRAELQELDLLKYCRTALENWASKNPAD